MRSTLAVSLVALACFGSLGCRKKTAPQYYELESRYTVAVARDGDDAYAAPEMDQLVTALTAIPVDAVEGPKAQAILAAISGARARLAQEKAEAAKAVVPTVVPTIPADPPPLGTGPSAAAAELDAGGPPKEPLGGMSLEDFKKYFGLCMVDVGPTSATGVTEKGHGFVNQDSTLCRSSLHLDDSSKATYIFVGGKLAERKLERTTLMVIDAGFVPAQVVEQQAQAPFVPGMPAPEGTLSPQDAG